MTDKSLLRDFIAETGEHLEETERNLIRLEQQPNDAALLNDIFRSIHTIKGSSEYLGLERTAAVLQSVETNYHIDILHPLVEAAGDVCSVAYDAQSESGRRLRRIADHIRACTFAIHENVYPDSQKQGYVVRKLLRRAGLDGHQMGVREPFLHLLVGRVAELMRTPYPELGETVERVAQGIRNEEESFFATIDRGLSRAERLFEQLMLDTRLLVDETHPGLERAMQDVRRAVYLVPRRAAEMDDEYAGHGVDLMELARLAQAEGGELETLDPAVLAGALDRWAMEMDTVLIETVAAERDGRLARDIARIERDRGAQREEEQLAH